MNPIERLKATMAAIQARVERCARESEECLRETARILAGKGGGR